MHPARCFGDFGRTRCARVEAAAPTRGTYRQTRTEASATTRFRTRGSRHLGTSTLVLRHRSRIRRRTKTPHHLGPDLDHSSGATVRPRHHLQSRRTRQIGRGIPRSETGAGKHTRGQLLHTISGTPSKPPSDRDPHRRGATIHPAARCLLRVLAVTTHIDRRLITCAGGAFSLRFSCTYLSNLVAVTTT